MTNCTVLTHASDVNRVVQYFRNKYKKIAIVGHSKGGPSIIYSDTNKVDAIVLWDPSSMYSSADLMEGMGRQPRYVKAVRGYVFDWGVEMIMGVEMMKDYDRLKPVDEAKKITKPIKIICAAKGNPKAGKQYIRILQDPKELVTIKNADHNFNTEGTEEQLFKETLSWVKKYT